MVFHYIDFIGMVINILYTIYLARLKSWSWFLGVAGAIPTIILYIHVELFAPIILQLIYIIFFLYGWYSWDKKKNIEKEIRWLKFKDYIKYLIITFVLCFLAVKFNSIIGSKEVYFSGISTGLALASVLMTIEGFIENWIIWCVVDLCFVVLQFSTGIYWHSFGSLIYFFTAVYGFIYWYKKSKQ